MEIFLWVLTFSIEESGLSHLQPQNLPPLDKIFFHTKLPDQPAETGSEQQ